MRHFHDALTEGDPRAIIELSWLIAPQLPAQLVPSPAMLTTPLPHALPGCDPDVPARVRAAGAESREWLYDLIREVVELHRGFPRPAVVATSGGSPRVIRQHYPAACPEVLRPVQLPVTNRSLTVLDNRSTLGLSLTLRQGGRTRGSRDGVMDPAQVPGDLGDGGCRFDAAGRVWPASAAAAVSYIGAASHGGAAGQTGDCSNSGAHGSRAGCAGGGAKAGWSSAEEWRNAPLLHVDR